MSTLTQLRPERAHQILREGGLLIDLRAVERYLTNHVVGSISILFEPGPGFGGRARDILPLDARLVLLGDHESPETIRAAAMLRAKGFDIAGVSALGDWQEKTATADALPEEYPGKQLIDVADPGTITPRGASGSELEGVTFIPAETLWARADEIDRSEAGVLSGWGVRAASAVGILEKIGVERVWLVRTRPKGSRPPSTEGDRAIFRVGGPA